MQEQPAVQWRRGKPDAPRTSTGSPAAGRRVSERLVVQGESDGVEHVLPEAFLPAAVLCQVDAERWKIVGDCEGDFGFLGLAVPCDNRADALGGVGSEIGMGAGRQVAGSTRQPVNIIEPGHGMTVGLLDYDRIGSMQTDPPPQVTSGNRKPVGPWNALETKRSARDQPLASENCVAEFSEPRIDGEDGVRLASHGRYV